MERGILGRPKRNVQYKHMQNPNRTTRSLDDFEAASLAVSAVVVVFKAPLA